MVKAKRERRKFTAAEKKALVHRVDELLRRPGSTVQGACKMVGIYDSLYRNWKYGDSRTINARVKKANQKGEQGRSGSASSAETGRKPGKGNSPEILKYEWREVKDEPSSEVPQEAVDALNELFKDDGPEFTLAYKGGMVTLTCARDRLVDVVSHLHADFSKD